MNFEETVFELVFGTMRLVRLRAKTGRVRDSLAAF